MLNISARSFLPAILMFLAALAGRTASAAEITLRDGDRVVLIGGTLIEREASYGNWELMLTARFPGRNVTFRNLGRSGDTVWGEAHAESGAPASGFQALKKQVEALRPTVILVGYGAHEALAGEEGLPRFNAGLKTLLDALAATKARIVILAPLKHEHLAPPLPDPTEHNKRLWHYIDALHEQAIGRDHLWIDLEFWMESFRQGKSDHFWTNNGTQLSEVGYWVTAAMLENELQFAPSGWTVDLEHAPTDALPQIKELAGARLSRGETSGAGMKFTLRSDVLPCTAPLRQPGRAGTVRFRNLPPGQYALSIDGTKVATASAEDWTTGLAVDDPAETRQIEALRQAIIKKNELCFRRWRPQQSPAPLGNGNGEPSQKDQEIAELDREIAEQEQKIAQLRAPLDHKFELRRVEVQQP